jgi:hypothetical protein
MKRLKQQASNISTVELIKNIQEGNYEDGIIFINKYKEKVILKTINIQTLVYDNGKELTLSEVISNTNYQIL